MAQACFEEAGAPNYLVACGLDDVLSCPAALRFEVKLSAGKSLLPANKCFAMTNGVAAFDGIARHDEPRVGRSLLQKLMKKGKRLPIPCVGVSEARKRRETEVNCVPDRPRATLARNRNRRFYGRALSEG